MSEVDDFLLHYGVKGMKWGKTSAKSLVARDSSGTPINDSEKSGHRVRLEAAGLKKGLSQSDSEKMAQNRIQTEKILLGVGAVALVGLAAYSAKQGYAKSFTEINLPAGFELKNINALGDKQDLNRRMFTTINDGDNQKYKGLLAKTLHKNQDNSTVYEMTLKAKENIKAPSQKQAQKLYSEWSKTTNMGKGQNYRQFNQQLVTDSVRNKYFYEFMKKKGYNAILDANDQFMSGYDTKHPLILFNAQSSTVKTGQKVVDKQLTNKLANKQLVSVLTKQLAPTIGLGLAYVGGKKALDTKNRNGAVNKYFKDHPESKLSYAEVYANLKSRNGNYSYNDPVKKKG